MEAEFSRLEIAESRHGVWEQFEVRRHELAKVFLNEMEIVDLLLVGTAFIKPQGKDQFKLEFIARAVLKETSEGLRIHHYQSLSPNPSGQPFLAEV